MNEELGDWPKNRSTPGAKRRSTPGEKWRSTPGDKWEVEMDVDTRRKRRLHFPPQFPPKFPPNVRQISAEFPLDVLSDQRLFYF